MVSVSVIIGILSPSELLLDGLLQLRAGSRQFLDEWAWPRRGSCSGRVTVVRFSILFLCCRFCSLFVVYEGYLMLGFECFCSRKLAKGVVDGRGCRHVDVLIMLGICAIVLPVHKLYRRDHEVAVWPNTVSKDGRETEAMVALVVVVSERDFGSIHGVLILGGRVMHLYMTSFECTCMYRSQSTDIW